MMLMKVHAQNLKVTFFIDWLYIYTQLLLIICTYKNTNYIPVVCLLSTWLLLKHLHKCLHVKNESCTKLHFTTSSLEIKFIVYLYMHIYTRLTVYKQIAEMTIIWLWLMSCIHIWSVNLTWLIWTVIFPAWRRSSYLHAWWYTTIYWFSREAKRIDG